MTLLSYGTFIYEMFDGAAHYKKVWSQDHIRRHNYFGFNLALLTSWVAWPFGLALVIWTHKKKQIKLLAKN